MPTAKKPAPRAPAAAKSAARKTDSAPARLPSGAEADAPVQKAMATQETVAAMPYAEHKLRENGFEAGVEPPTGTTVELASDSVGASTLSERNTSDKVGTAAAPGINATIDTLDRVRADATGQPMTTAQGVRIADNQHSLKAGLRGPVLLEDHILREKITAFDHERIPERVVHARGSAAHGYFECYDALTELTKAAPFAEKGKVTPVFTRFSTVAGERGSKDTARDVRGFAVKFYTDEGIWDLVGNNIPVFFIQDAIKFPDLIHAAKPEPHHAMPQAATAHDTFWDFVSLSPESTHMLTWIMSDRAIPRSYRMMQGFGVHTFRMITAAGEARFVKFHWEPKLGTHSLVWDEAVKISGADPDFHRRDLWEAIEAGEYPEWELGLQVFTEDEAAGFSFDILDATKIVPEELVPVQKVGRMVLNRNPDNFFAETEQVAFCTSHLVPGIDHSNDPLLAGRNHSYLDTQISRLGGPNFSELPINASIAPVANGQRDGKLRQTIHRGRVSYEPNSLGGGCPFQAGAATGFTSFPEPIQGDKVRGNPEKFADHYTQATLFYESQEPWEQMHMASAFRFELSKLTVPAIRERMLAGIVNISPELASRVAKGLGMAVPDPLPKALADPAEPEVTESAALSLTARPGDGSIRTRGIAVLVAPGVDSAAVTAVQRALVDAGAICRLVGPRIGAIEGMGGEMLQADASLENEPGFLFDGMVIPGGDKAVQALSREPQAKANLLDQYLHGKALLLLGEAEMLLDAAGVPRMAATGDDDPGLIVAANAADGVARFIEALSKRYPERAMTPPTA